MAIKKVLTIKLAHAQARRIKCEHCGEPYTWVDGGVKTGRAEAGAVLADENELRRESFRKVTDALVEAAANEQVGRGRCPHCHQLQQWMFISRGAAVGGSLIAAVVAAGALGLVAYWLASTTIAVYVGGGAAGLGVVLALAFGGRLADRPGPQPDERDAHVKTDEQLLDLIEAAAGSGVDPFVYWWGAIGDPPSDSTPISLGLLDRSATPLQIDEALTTDARTRALSAMDG